MVVAAISRLRNIMIRKKFLILTVLIIFLLLLGASFFYFCWSKDNLIKFVPENTVFYAHFDFNIYHWSGKKANIFFQNKWPDKFFREIGLEKYWSLFRCNLNPQILAGIQELAFLIVENKTKNQFQPLLIYKFQPAFADMSFVLCRKDDFQVRYQFLDSDKRIVLLSLAEIDLPIGNFRSSHSQNKFKFENFLANNFLNGFVSQKFLEEKILLKRINEEYLVFSGKLNNQKIYFQFDGTFQNSSSLGLIDSNFLEQSFKFFPEKVDFVFWNFDFLSSKSLLLTNIVNSQSLTFLKNRNNLFFNRDGSLIIIFSRENESVEYLEDEIKKSLAYFFPKKEIRILPDKSRIVELIADPNIFDFSAESFGPFEIRFLKITEETAQFAMAVGDNFILISNDLIFLREIIEQYLKNEIIFSEVSDYIKWRQSNNLQEIFWRFFPDAEFNNFILRSLLDKEGNLTLEGVIF